jgi:CRP-like cAMP-binding protein
VAPSARNASPIAAASSAASLLAQLPLFRGTPRSQLAALARVAAARHVAAGGVVLRRGERVPGLMVVQQGLVKISLKGDSERVLRLVGAADTFGEAPLVLNEPLQFDVTAIADTALLIVPAEPLLAMFDRDPRFARRLLAAVCRRLESLVADFEAATVHDAGERLAAYLDSLGKDTACLPAPKAVIASRLGMTKETLSRLLRTFIDRGLIEVAKREIRILDRARLSAAARSSASSRG